jgi:hypothetical protein
MSTGLFYSKNGDRYDKVAGVWAAMRELTLFPLNEWIADANGRLEKVEYRGLTPIWWV